MTVYEIGYIISAFLLVIAVILAISAQVKVQSTYEKYKNIPSSIDMTGAELAQMLISREGLNVIVQSCRGNLSDNYNPSNRTLNISQGN